MSKLTDDLEAALKKVEEAKAAAAEAAVAYTATMKAVEAAQTDAKNLWTAMKASVSDVLGDDRVR